MSVTAVFPISLKVQIVTMSKNVGIVTNIATDFVNTKIKFTISSK